MADTMRCNSIRTLPNGRVEATVTFTVDSEKDALEYVGRALGLLDKAKAKGIDWSEWAFPRYGR